MLSRSSSNAADRLRRSKSVSSVHTASSGHRRAQTAIDPFVTRQHAEAAAHEAFRRAHPLEQSALSHQRSTGDRAQRRRSQARGKSEGSHLQDARLGRRRSTAARDDATRPTQGLSILHQDGRASDSANEEVTFTRRRSVIHPSASVEGHGHNIAGLPPPARSHRRPASVAIDGSPTPRRSTAAQYQSNTLQAARPSYGREDEAQRYTSTPSRRYTDSYEQEPKPLKPSIRETQTDEDILSMARDRCLQDFQQNRLREPRSFVFGSVQKLQNRGSTVQKAAQFSHDKSIPPFNFADELGCVPPTNDPAPDPAVIASGQKIKGRGRIFSDTVKNRFKRLLRKTSRAPSALPPQHVEAKHLHYSVTGENLAALGHHDNRSLMWTRHLSPPPDAAPAPPPEIRISSVSSNASGGGDSVTKSRVTSWTNSTVAGTTGTRAGAVGPDGDVNEHGVLQRSASIRNLRQRGSFFGRSVQNKLRKASRAELREPQQSQGLFAALQGLIHTPDKGEQDAARQCSDGSVASHAGSALSSLPSQQRLGSGSSSVSRQVATTIRTVTPDARPHQHHRIMSPVTEVLSPVGHVNDHGNSDMTVTPTDYRLSHPRMPARSAPAVPVVPSHGQVARRVERSQNRWRSPLDASTSSNENGQDKQYDPGAVSRPAGHSGASYSGGVPRYVRVAEQSPQLPQNMLSPSVYSRASDGASPRVATPEEPVSTMITITDRQVRRYSLSPSKAQQYGVEHRPIQASRDWRRWLSDEMHGLSQSPGPEDLAFGKEASTTANASTTALRGLSSDDQLDAETSYNEQRERESCTPPAEADLKGAEKSRPRAGSRRSSFMNERYPMIESSRNPSRQSGRQSRGTSGHRSFSGATETTRSREASSGEKRKSRRATASGEHAASHRSVGELVAGLRSVSALGTYDGEATMSGALPVQDDVSQTTAAPSASKVPSKAKSAFELRANFRSSVAGESRPLEVRRKTPAKHANMMLDETLRNIAAGPYASEAGTGARASPGPENTPPATHDDKGLPALSSSEWLAGPMAGKRGSAQSTAGTVSRFAAGAPALYTGKRGSPGQRLVTGWLESRSSKSREDLPAFI